MRGCSSRNIAPLFPRMLTRVFSHLSISTVRRYCTCQNRECGSKVEVDREEEEKEEEEATRN
jgi:hypothetical protein